MAKREYEYDDRQDQNVTIEVCHSADEIRQQATLLRNMSAYGGVCYYNAKNFKENRLGINKVMYELHPKVIGE